MSDEGLTFIGHMWETMAMPQRDDLIEEMKRTDLLLYDFLRQRHLVLFLLFVQMDILRLPRLGENIVPGVKIYGMKPLYGLRRTSIKSDSGELLVVANALGAFFDLDKGRAAVIDPSEVPCSFDEPEPMTCLPRRIPRPGEGGVPGEPFVVRRSKIDMNGHMTSCEYLAEAVNAFACADAFDRIRIEYKQQAKLGERPRADRIPDASRCGRRSQKHGRPHVRNRRILPPGLRGSRTCEALVIRSKCCEKST